MFSIRNIFFCWEWKWLILKVQEILDLNYCLGLLRTIYGILRLCSEFSVYFMNYYLKCFKIWIFYNYGWFFATFKNLSYSGDHITVYPKYSARHPKIINFESKFLKILQIRNCFFIFFWNHSLMSLKNMMQFEMHESKDESYERKDSQTPSTYKN